ncbi:MAG TPA: hypothetical protein VNH11_29560 [Pirellulales bacterium]|nr:hypothetical protein [Pirellulales bacterium]
MLLDNLAFRTARAWVHSFTGEYDELAARHQAAMDCLHCEAFLQLGIDAFHWLNRADQQLRQEIYAGRLEYDAEVDEALGTLYRLWLRPYEDAEKWVAIQERRGYKIDNLELFRDCFREVRSLVDSGDEIAGELAAIRDQAIEAHRSGDSTCWETGESPQPAV